MHYLKKFSKVWMGITKTIQISSTNNRNFALINRQEAEKIINDINTKYAMWDKMRKNYDEEFTPTEGLSSQAEKHKIPIKDLNDLISLRKTFYSDKELEEKDVKELAELYHKYDLSVSKEYEIDKSKFYGRTIDKCRIDVGIIIQRPAIFLSISDREMEWLKYRYNFMMEYDVNYNSLEKDMEMYGTPTEELMDEAMPKRYLNPDNYPTHRVPKPVDNNNIYKNTSNSPEIYSDDEDILDSGEYDYIWAASKNYLKSDIYMSDPHSIQYAGKHRIFLLVKDIHTGEWGFPTSTLYMDESFVVGKNKLFEQLSGGKWETTFAYGTPLVTTLRDFSIVENEDEMNEGLIGVRTYYFGGLHQGGMTYVDKLKYADYAWARKCELGKYLEESYYNLFINALWRY